MKQTILSVAIAASLLSLAPGLQARDHWDDDFQSDIHSLWEWQGHLQDEASHRGDRRIHDELDSTRAGLQDVEHQLHDHHYHTDRVRGELDGIRDQLRHISDEMHWHGEVHHRPGFIIEFH